MSRRERQRRRRHSRGGSTRPLLVILGVVTTILAVGVLCVVGWVVSIATSGPSLDSLKPEPQGSASVVYAADHTRLGFITSNILRTEVSGNEIPDVVRSATVAIEDRRFYQHKGVDFEGVIRAALKNLESKNDVQGGSTLTMQLIRNLYTKDKTRTGLEGYKRKIREAKLAEELENRHPGARGKRWILDSYLNNVPYGTVGGQTAVGIQAAARTFYDKSAKALTLSEAALLAGLPQAPSLYNPFQHPDRAKARRDDVLAHMAKQGDITAQQAAAAQQQPIGVKQNRYYSTRRESYFFDYVRQQLVDTYGVHRVRQGGMHIYTTLDLRMQKAARRSLQKALNGTDRSGAIVSVDPRTGQIRAMASNARYGHSQFNLASQGGYAAGSTFKVMVLMTALRRGVDPYATTYDSERLLFTDPKYGKIDVQTYGHDYVGRINLVRATLRSDNSVYQQLDLDLGPDAVKRTAIDMGIKAKLFGFPAEGLGAVKHGVSPLEMANAYATIASGGWRNRVTALQRVCLPHTQDDGYDCRDSTPHRHRAFQDGVTAEATGILKQNVQAGTGVKAQIGCPAAGKTGTVDNFTDAWFVGYTPHLSTAVWVGHATERRTLGPGAAGGEVAAPIWADYMKVARGTYCGDFPAPVHPFHATPFFGTYSRNGVVGNQAAYAPSSDPVAAATPPNPAGGGTQFQSGTGHGQLPPSATTPPAPAPAPAAPVTPAPAPATGGAPPP